MLNNSSSRLYYLAQAQVPRSLVEGNEPNTILARVTALNSAHRRIANGAPMFVNCHAPHDPRTKTVRQGAGLDRGMHAARGLLPGTTLLRHCYPHDRRLAAPTCGVARTCAGCSQA